MLQTMGVAMNRRYSGDIRDLFKIDLVCHLMKEIPALESFTFVPMLTAGKQDAGQRSARKSDLADAVARGKAGSRNTTLLRHMARLQEIDSDTEYFQGIQSLFRQENIMIRILGEPGFSHQDRCRYFNSLSEQFPKKSLLFLDPDIGLEVKNSTERHLLYDEVRRIHDCLDRGSVIMIYQHIPRVTREPYIRKRMDGLEDCTGSRPVSVTDNEIVFFLIVKDPRSRAAVERAVGTYTARYPVLVMSGQQLSAPDHVLP